MAAAAPQANSAEKKVFWSRKAAMALVLNVVAAGTWMCGLKMLEDPYAQSDVKAATQVIAIWESTQSGEITATKAVAKFEEFFQGHGGNLAADLALVLLQRAGDSKACDEFFFKALFSLPNAERRHLVRNRLDNTPL
jgi:predicted negative regulator of RcsB-dependent stress response